MILTSNTLLYIYYLFITYNIYVYIIIIYKTYIMIILVYINYIQ